MTATHTRPNYAWLWALGLLAVLLVVFRPGAAPDVEVRHVRVEEARALIVAGAIVVDVRGPSAYGGRHIPGAISVPLRDLRDAIPESLAASIAKPVVVYCGDGVSIGPEATALLNAAGYSQAVNLQAGIEGWADAGQPVEGSATTRG